MISTKTLTTGTQSTIYIPNDTAVPLSWLLEHENVEYEMKLIDKQKNITDENIINWIKRCETAGLTKKTWKDMPINSITTNFNEDDIFEIAVRLIHDDETLKILAAKHTTTVPDGYDFGDKL